MQRVFFVPLHPSEDQQDQLAQLSFEPSPRLYAQQLVLAMDQVTGRRYVSFASQREAEAFHGAASRRGAHPPEEGYILHRWEIPFSQGEFPLIQRRLLEAHVAWLIFANPDYLGVIIPHRMFPQLLSLLAWPP
ncbi:MAG: hypothetical protein KM310_11450 [Clostridiales bacterium]|nr:hypothetical protein [Clostridiales bacterium]